MNGILIGSTKTRSWPLPAFGVPTVFTVHASLVDMPSIMEVDEIHLTGQQAHKSVARRLRDASNYAGTYMVSRSWLCTIHRMFITAGSMARGRTQRWLRPTACKSPATQNSRLLRFPDWQCRAKPLKYTPAPWYTPVVCALLFILFIFAALICLLPVVIYEKTACLHLPERRRCANKSFCELWRTCLLGLAQKQS